MEHQKYSYHQGNMKAFDNSFLLKTIYQWNSLARNVMDAPSLNTFSSCVDGVKQAVPKPVIVGNYACLSMCIMQTLK